MYHCTKTVHTNYENKRLDTVDVAECAPLRYIFGFIKSKQAAINLHEIGS